MIFRIRDLLAGRTLITSNRGRDLVAYWDSNFVPGRSDWIWQYSRDGEYWRDIPGSVRRTWRDKSHPMEEK